jgi:hypothetical protein
VCFLNGLLCDLVDVSNNHVIVLIMCSYKTAVCDFAAVYFLENVFVI